MLLQQAAEQTNLNSEEIRALEKLLKRVKDKYQNVISTIVIYGATLRQGADVKRKDLNVLIIMGHKDTDLARKISEIAGNIDKKVTLDPKVISLEEYCTEAQYETSFYNKVTQEGIEVYKNAALAS